MGVKRDILVPSGVRTAIGGYNGGLKDFSPTGLGRRAAVHAAQQIALVEADVTIGAGVESMSRSGYPIPHARRGARMGDTRPLDMMATLRIGGQGIAATFERV
jgi:acetyl-CoA acetyltransferase